MLRVIVTGMSDSVAMCRFSSQSRIWREDARLTLLYIVVLTETDADVWVSRKAGHVAKPRRGD
jgi:hypothetical protein